MLTSHDSNFKYMRFESITIKDIAKALGLSTSTVSRSLSDSYEISLETKQKVINYAKENNYRPNPIALSLKDNYPIFHHKIDLTHQFNIFGEIARYRNYVC